MASLDSAVSAATRLADLSVTLAARAGDTDRAATGLDGLVALQQELVRSAGDLHAADAALVIATHDPERAARHGIEICAAILATDGTARSRFSRPAGAAP